MNSTIERAGFGSRLGADGTKQSITESVGKLLPGNAAEIMASWPDGSVDLIITSPPYWTAVEYDGEAPDWPTYEAYLDDMIGALMQSLPFGLRTSSNSTRDISKTSRLTTRPVSSLRRT